MAHTKVRKKIIAVGVCMFFAETLWLMRGAQPMLEVEIGGVAAVQFLAGYSGFPEQSRILRFVTRRYAGCEVFQTTN